MADGQRPAWMGGEHANNLWRWWWADASGYTDVIETRGPTTEAELRQHAEMILDAMRRNAIEAGHPDPGLHITDITPSGQDYVSPFGAFKPAGARPVDLERYGKPVRETADNPPQ